MNFCVRIAPHEQVTHLIHIWASLPTSLRLHFMSPLFLLEHKQTATECQFCLCSPSFYLKGFFLCIIAGFLPYDIKHLKATIVVIRRYINKSEMDFLNLYWGYIQNHFSVPFFSIYGDISQQLETVCFYTKKKKNSIEVVITATSCLWNWPKNLVFQFTCVLL